MGTPPPGENRTFVKIALDSEALESSWPMAGFLPGEKPVKLTTGKHHGEEKKISSNELHPTGNKDFSALEATPPGQRPEMDGGFFYGRRPAGLPPFQADA